MDIKKAKSLKPGDSVYCPADRGEGAYKGTVIQDCVDCPTYRTPGGVEYIWIQVKGSGYLGTRKAVWPSNRLS